MGTTFGWKSREELAAELLGWHGGAVASKSTAYGKHLWAVFKPAEGESYLTLFLLMKHGKDWGYKPISESMGPCDTDCPLALLDLAPVADADWRARVRTAAKRAKATFTAGDRVLVYGVEYEVTGTIKRSFLIRKVLADGSLGGTFKSTAKKMRLASEVAAEKAAREAELAAAPYMGIAAFGDWADFVPEGMVGVKATKGANREGFGDTLHVLVPKATYDARTGSYILTGAETPWVNHTAPAPKIVRTF